MESEQNNINKEKELEAKSSLTKKLTSLPDAIRGLYQLPKAKCENAETKEDAKEENPEAKSDLTQMISLSEAIQSICQLPEAECENAVEDEKEDEHWEHRNCCNLCALDIDTCKEYIKEHTDKEKEHIEKRDVWFFEAKSDLEMKMEEVKELQMILAKAVEKLHQLSKVNCENNEQVEEESEAEDSSSD